MLTELGSMKKVKCFRGTYLVLGQRAVNKNNSLISKNWRKMKEMENVRKKWLGWTDRSKESSCYSMYILKREKHMHSKNVLLFHEVTQRASRSNRKKALYVRRVCTFLWLQRGRHLGLWHHICVSRLCCRDNWKTLPWLPLIIECKCQSPGHTYQGYFNALASSCCLHEGRPQQVVHRVQLVPTLISFGISGPSLVYDLTLSMTYLTQLHSLYKENERRP